MVDLREMSNSAAQLPRKCPGQFPTVHTFRGGLRALPANIGILSGIGRGGGQSLSRDFHFRGRVVGAFTPAASLTGKMQGSG